MVKHRKGKGASSEGSNSSAPSARGSKSKSGGNAAGSSLATKALIAVAVVCVAYVVASKTGLTKKLIKNGSNTASSPGNMISKRCLRFHKAVFRGDMRQVEDILKRGKIDVNCEGPPVDAELVFKAPGYVSPGLPPVHYAAGVGNVNMVKRLMKAGADIHQQTSRYGPAITLVYGGFHPKPSRDHEAVFRALVKAGASPNTPDPAAFGQQPLHYAARRNLIPAAKLILSLGGDINAKCDDGYTPLHYAIEFQTGVAQVLVEGGADAGIGDSRGRTPLHTAVLWAVPQLIQGLAHAVPREVLDIKDHDGRTVFDLVRERPGLPAIEPLLFNQGANRDTRGTRYPPNRVPVEGVASKPAGGGWSRTPQPDHDIDRCDFDRIHYSNLTVERFIRDYYSTSRPLMIEGATGGWPAWDNWSKDGLIRRYSDVQTLAGSIPYPDKYDSDPRIHMYNTTVKDFIRGMVDGDPWILFDANMHKKAPHFLSDYKTLPPFRICGEVSPPQFSLGGFPAGAPFHSHIHAWNALIYGRKRWFLVPPGLNTAHSVDTNRPSERTFSWLEKGGREDYLSKDLLYECVQDSGDLMFIPRGWSHATLNLADTVNIAQEFCSAWGWELPWHQRVSPSWYGEIDDGKLQQNLQTNPNVLGKLSSAVPPHIRKQEARMRKA